MESFKMDKTSSVYDPMAYFLKKITKLWAT